MTERESFETAIKEDPYDMDIRKVYADWLDEFGSDADHDLAIHHRTWTVKKQEAWEWLDDFASKINETGYAHLTVDEIVDICKKFLETGEAFDDWKVGMFPPDVCESEADTLWKKFHDLTGIDTRLAYEWGNNPFSPEPPFTCSC